MTDSAYGPTRALCDTILKRFGITTIYYDPMLGAGIADLITDKTRAIFLESPGTHTFEVQDVPAICAAARARGIATLIDNTWATPLYLPAISLGVDISILACTKYIGGHADLMLGAVTVTEAFAKRLERTRRTLGQSAGPDEAWLALRGLQNPLRPPRPPPGKRPEGRALARRPAEDRPRPPPRAPRLPRPRISSSATSGARPASSPSSSPAATTRPPPASSSASTLFGIGYSWGAFESLAVPGHFTRTATAPRFEGPLVRLHIGLEDPDDLIADLEAALGEYPG